MGVCTIALNRDFQKNFKKSQIGNRLIKWYDNRMNAIISAPLVNNVHFGKSNSMASQMTVNMKVLRESTVSNN